MVISCAGKEIARHDRSYGKGEHIYEPLHYLGVLARKPRAITDGAPFRGWELPDVFGEYRRLLKERYKDGDIYFAKTLILLRDWPIKEVTEAVRKAVTTKVLGDSYILSLLRQQAVSGQEETSIAINAELAKYEAMQSPLSAYDEILSKKEVQ